MVLVAYAAVLVITLLVRDRVSPAAGSVISVLPAIPFAGVGWAMCRSLARVDERERSLGYRAIAFAFFATGATTFAYGLLEQAGATRISMFAVWPIMTGFWILGRWVAPRMP